MISDTILGTIIRCYFIILGTILEAVADAITGAIIGAIL